MTSATTVALGSLSDYLPHQAESLRDLVEIHYDRLSSGDLDTHFDMLPDAIADPLRQRFDLASEVDFRAIERDLETVLRTRLRSVDIDLVNEQLISRIPELTPGELRPVVLRIILKADIGTLYDLHARPV